jgi:hypothetical protein
MDKRTPSGAPSEQAREKYGEKDGSFPIFDKKSALAALRLRGRAKSAAERADIIRRAAKYAPDEAKAAYMADHGK